MLWVWVEFDFEKGWMYFDVELGFWGRFSRMRFFGLSRCYRCFAFVRSLLSRFLGLNLKWGVYKAV